MCGILGTINFNELKKEDFFQHLYHRGPDNFGYHKENNFIIIINYSY